MSGIRLDRAAVSLRAGGPADAVRDLRAAAAGEPSNALLHHDLGLACLEAGLIAEAADALRRAVTCRPRYADAWLRLGIALEEGGDLPGAVTAYDRATEVLPSMTEAWFRAGAAVYTLGHRSEAIGCFRRAASSGPKTSFGRLARARGLLAEQKDAEAERTLRQLLALDRDNAMALDLLGNLLAEAGRFEEARARFEHAVAAAPLMAGSYYDLARCRRITEADTDLLARMEAASAQPGLNDEQRLRVHLACGKAAADLGHPALAMHHFAAAQGLRRRIAPFDPAAFDAEVDRLIARFTPDALAAAARAGRDDPTPIVIVGMPRSGTTLVEQIVSSHPDVAGGGELTFWNERGASWLQAGRSLTDLAFLGQAGADYLGVLRGIGPGSARVTDKMPFNFLWTGLIHAALPRAVILHCRRPAIDVALSIHQTHFSPRLPLPTGGTDLVSYLGAYSRLTEHWRRVLPPDRFVEVDYEALTRAPKPVIRQIVAACGLDWHDACLHPERNPRVLRTASRWQARQPINRDSAERWRRYEPWLGELRALLADRQDTDSSLTD